MPPATGTERISVTMEEFWTIWASPISTVVATAVAIFAFVLTWRTETRKRLDEDLDRKEKRLRQSEVVAWSIGVVQGMQAVSILCSKSYDWVPEEKTKERLLQLSIELSCAVEVGRLYFKNEAGDNEDVPIAYRGLRPAILDEILICHDVARDWPLLSEYQRGVASSLARKATREFVSLVQQEVGRSEVAHSYNAKGGSGRRLGHYLTESNTASMQ
jgi:hypothetical protein